MFLASIILLILISETCQTIFIFLRDGEITCLKEGEPCHEGWRLLRQQLKLNNTEKPTHFELDDVDVDSANPEILTVEKDKDGNEDVDVEIDR